MNDNEAILRCQGGDREAFRHLVERYKDALFGTAVLMTGNRATLRRNRCRRLCCRHGEASAGSRRDGR